MTQDHASIVIIDSLNGCLNSMPEERFLTAQLHELPTYLGQHGVASILIGAQWLRGRAGRQPAGVFGPLAVAVRAGSQRVFLRLGLLWL